MICQNQVPLLFCNKKTTHWAEIRVLTADNIDGNIAFAIQSNCIIMCGKLAGIYLYEIAVGNGCWRKYVCRSSEVCTKTVEV